MEIQKFEYLDNKKSFLGEIKKLSRFVKGCHLVKNKRLLKSRGHRL